MIGILGLSRDITKDYLARQRYQQELKYLFELPEDTYAALYMDIDDWRVIQHTRHDVGGIELSLQSTMEEFTSNALVCIADGEGSEARAFFQNLSQESMLEMSRDGKRQYALEYPRRMPNKEIMWVHMTIHFLTEPETGHRCAIWLLQNIQSRKQANLNLLHAAEHDALTGLWNRSYTTGQIQKTLEEFPDAMHALFVIDIDNFKLLNDTKGHQMGDKFLVELSRILKSSFRETDIVGRFGGDEFFVFMRNISNELAVAEKAQTVLAVCKLTAQHYLDELSVSIGAGVYPHHGVTMEELYAKADEALYRAKKNKNTFLFAEEL